MKRKFKLFATVASLCLCLALMAFGVYAATSITYTASGKVSFDLDEDVWASFKVEAWQYGYKAGAIAGGEAAGTTSDSYTETAVDLDGIGEKGYLEWDASADEKNKDAKMTGSHSLPTFDFNTSYLYKIRITVTRTNGSVAANVKSTITLPQTHDGYNLVNVDSENDNNQALGTSKDDAVVLEYYLFLTDNTSAISASDASKFNIQVSVTAKQTETTT